MRNRTSATWATTSSKSAPLVTARPDELREVRHQASHSTLCLMLAKMDGGTVSQPFAAPLRRQGCPGFDVLPCTPIVPLELVKCLSLSLSLPLLVSVSPGGVLISGGAHLPPGARQRLPSLFFKQIPFSPTL